MADTIYMNRELSWLKFNERVLEEAENPENPLCERLTFASIYQSNLDEFYMVRVGSLVDQMLLAKDIRENKTNMTPKEQLDAILARTKKLNRKRDVVYEEIMESLEEYGVHMLNFQRSKKKTAIIWNVILRQKWLRLFLRLSSEKGSRFHFSEIKKSMQ